MPLLEWDQIDERRYEAGVNQGVFYPVSGPGVPWNGLTNVAETIVGAEQSSRYFEGVKYLDTIGGTNYQANVTAFSAPREFDKYDGAQPLIPGFYLSDQPKLRFNFSYATGINENEYKIHLVYNVLATATSVGYSTKNATVDPTLLSWKFDATPIIIDGFKPAAHLVADSSRMPSEKLFALEEFLYGTEETDPAFPTLAELIALLED